MLKINPLIDLFFKEDSFPERMPKIAECGYKYVETWQGADADLLKSMGDAGKECGVELVSIVLNSPNGEDTAPVDRSKHEAFLEQLDRFSDNALAAGCSQGIATTGPALKGTSREEQKESLIEAMKKAGENAAAKGFTLVLEPLNTLVDHKGYFLDCRAESVEIVTAVGLDNVKLLYDFYHMEIMHGNQTEFVLENIDIIGHFHSAGVPGRHELFTGETNYPFLIKKIAETNYDRYFGLEYFPELESKESLTKTLEYLQ
ncbi:MAG: TIM barrel protein [Planctomycetota bacterium]|jgi:hydroxypyruvate isomerase